MTKETRWRRCDTRKAECRGQMKLRRGANVMPRPAGPAILIVQANQRVSRVSVEGFGG